MRWTATARLRLLALGLLCPLSASAANLLTNPGFDTGLTGWTNVVAAHPVAFSSQIDAQGNLASGALVADLTITGGVIGGSCGGATQCVPVTAGTSYTLGGQTIVAPFSQLSTPPAPKAEIAAAYFDGPGCTGNVLAVQMAAPVNTGATPNVWQTAATSPTPAPATAVSALVGVSTCTGNPAPQSIATIGSAYDNLVFGPQSGVAEVPALSATGLAILAAALALAAVALLRRH